MKFDDGFIDDDFEKTQKLPFLGIFGSKEEREIKTEPNFDNFHKFDEQTRRDATNLVCVKSNKIILSIFLVVCA